MPFFCAICEVESIRICERCTKDTWSNHICERCRRCSDCCECEVYLDEPVREPARAAIHHTVPVASAEVMEGAAEVTEVLAASPSGESEVVGTMAEPVTTAPFGHGPVADGSGEGEPAEPEATTADRSREGELGEPAASAADGFGETAPATAPEPARNPDPPEPAHKQLRQVPEPAAPDPPPFRLIVRERQPAPDAEAAPPPGTEPPPPDTPRE